MACRCSPGMCQMLTCRAQPEDDEALQKALTCISVFQPVLIPFSSATAPHQSKHIVLNDTKLGKPSSAADCLAASKKSCRLSSAAALLVRYMSAMSSSSSNNVSSSFSNPNETQNNTKLLGCLFNTNKQHKHTQRDIVDRTESYRLETLGPLKDPLH